eukprot:TRINITY_DN3083_c0_g1_i2.p1 TRINITY_DN3083_c0_g1~~TRINITY_DN3083_c0_g1_i2.p1  ORF type:complete len:756 (+),score=256.67 TRINITY_DN3083_c0_g1_i2:32-2269(+)
MLWPLLSFVFVCSVIGIIVAILYGRHVLNSPKGDEKMQRVSSWIVAAANGFMNRQYKVIGTLSIVFALVIFGVWLLRGDVKTPIPIYSEAVLNAVSFLFGAICSGIAGYVGMKVAVRANLNTAAACVHSTSRGVVMALRAGGLSGFLVVSMSLAGVAGVYAITDVIFKSNPNVTVSNIPSLIVGYGFGASFVALFAQLGGGIYTKGADVGADLIGKVENDLREDDPRNAAVIADLTGDCAGDCAGRSADLFESLAAENIGAMILGASIAPKVTDDVTNVILFPLVVRSVGLLCCIIGTFFVREKDESKPLLGDDPSDLSRPVSDVSPMGMLNFGFVISAVLCTLGFWGTCYWLLDFSKVPGAWWKFGICGTIGIVAAWGFVIVTDYYTEVNRTPTNRIVESSKYGPANNAIAGISVGMESTAIPTLIISIALITSYWLGQTVEEGHGGLFGTAAATMGILTVCGYVLAMDVFGPIVDNAGGIVEMSDQDKDIRRRTDMLDACGNTTKALTKGYAIGSASLASFLLFSAFLDDAEYFSGLPRATVSLSNPNVFVAALIGAALVYLFSAWTMSAVGFCAEEIMTEVRQQLARLGDDELPSLEDYQRCTDIATRASLRLMVKPGLLVVLTPIAVGVIFRFIGQVQGNRLLGIDTLAGFLMIATISGILMALFLNNAGGAWDNAKKQSEVLYKEDAPQGSKNRYTLDAAVNGDCIGDFFKDAAGPSIHIFIKLIATVTLVLCPIFIGSK